MDRQDDRHGSPKTWNHASTNAQPSMRPLDASGLKPLTQLRPNPENATRTAVPQQSGAAPRPSSAIPTPQQGAPLPTWQPQPMQAIPPQGNRMAQPQVGTGAYPAAQGAPVPAWQPQPMQAIPPQGNRMPPQRPIPNAYPAAQGTPVPAWQPQPLQGMPQQGNRMQQPQPVTNASPTAQGAPVPAWQPQQTMPPQGTPNPAMRSAPGASPVAQGTPMPPMAQQQPVRHVWTQTMAPQPSVDMPPIVPATAQPVSSPPPQRQQTVVQRAPQPAAQSAVYTEEAAAVMASEPLESVFPADGTRRRRSAAHGHDSIPTEPETMRFAKTMPSADTSSVSKIEPNTQPTMPPIPSAVQTPSPLYAIPTPTAMPTSDTLDDDSGRYDAISSTVLAEPVPVPTHDVLRVGKARAKKKKHPVRTLLVLVLLLGGAAYAVYATGLWQQAWQLMRPLTQQGDSIPSVFSQSAQQQNGAADTILPATGAETPNLLTIGVVPTTAQSPAELVFTLNTNMAASAVLLLTQDNATIHTVANGKPVGDGLVWEVSATFSEPYTGKVRFFLRDAQGKWVESALTSEIAVQ